MKRHWVYRAGLITVILLLVWAAAAVVLNTASAEGLPLSLRLRSRLSADYGVDKGGPLKALNFSIIGDLLRDLGLAPDEVEEGEGAVRLALNDPVPTATARNFEGDEPFTPTPTNTHIPTSTSTATATRTPLPTRRPTITPTQTKISAATAVPSVDDEYPRVIDAGSLSHPFGSVGACDFTLSVAGVTIEDPGPSSGLAWAKLKYQVWDYNFSQSYTGLMYSAPLIVCSVTDLPGGGVSMCYDGPSSPFEINIYPGFSSKLDYDGPHFTIKVWLITKDNEGHETVFQYSGHYNMSADCDGSTPPTDTPTAPPDTPTPTDAAPPPTDTPTS